MVTSTNVLAVPAALLVRRLRRVTASAMRRISFRLRLQFRLHIGNRKPLLKLYDLQMSI